ncbi:hypothetical protein [Streptomyces sp. NPDC000410]|uniref:hypothetical protein n=1 Tax=Streptomyces sp. NPDC000410 TaxID=3154254 RepID=UPI00332680C5
MTRQTALDATMFPWLGRWTGTKGLRLMPDDAYDVSPAEATVTRHAGGHAYEIAYAWSHEGEPQEGLLVLSEGEAPGAIEALWVDTWHQKPQAMRLTGVLDAEGAASVEGAYGTEAGWRIRLGATPEGLLLAMDNLMEGLDYQVVEASFARSAAG